MLPVQPDHRYRTVTVVGLALLTLTLAGCASGGSKTVTSAGDTTAASDTAAAPSTGASDPGVSPTTSGPPASGSTPSAATSPSEPTSTPQTGTARPTNPAGALCPSSQLRLSATYLGEGNTEQTIGRIVLTNTGATTCTIQGYPGVSLLDESGAQVNKPAARELSSRSVAFTVVPGAAASTILVDNVSSPTGQDCLSQSRSVTVRVYPPNQTAALSAPLAMNPCYLSVRPLQAGANAQP